MSGSEYGQCSRVKLGLFGQSGKIPLSDTKRMDTNPIHSSRILSLSVRSIITCGSPLSMALLPTRT